MSRIGKQPVPIPDGITVEVKGNTVIVSSKGGKQSLSQDFDLVTVAVENNQVVVAVTDDSRQAAGRHGLYRTLIANMIDGIKTGWSKALEIHGAGYKVEEQGRTLVLTVGYTFPRKYQIPEGITVEVPNATNIVIKGIDKALVGQTAASLRGIRPPDPYKGKGIRYKGERAVRKTAKGK